MSKTKKQPSGQQGTGFVNRTSILSHVARYDRSNLEDENTLVLSYRSIGPDVTTLKQLGSKKRLTGVSTIFLDHNSLRKFEPAERLSGVKELYLDHNYIKEIDGRNRLLSGLETLSLTSNKLASLDNMDGFQELKVLRLGNNRITSLKGFTGGQISNTLDTLVLSHNQIAHMHDISALANFPALSVLDLRSNPIGTSPEVMKFVLLCCPNLRIFNGRKVGDTDVVASSEWASSTSRGRSVNCLIEVVREMETLTAQARQRSSTGLLRSDFIAYLSTYDEGSSATSAKYADEYIRTDPNIRSFKDPRFLAEEDRDIIRKEQLLAQYDAKVAAERAAGDVPEPVEDYNDEEEYENETVGSQAQYGGASPSQGTRGGHSRGPARGQASSQISPYSSEQPYGGQDAYPEEEDPYYPAEQQQMVGGPESHPEPEAAVPSGGRRASGSPVQEDPYEAQYEAQYEQEADLARTAPRGSAPQGGQAKPTRQGPASESSPEASSGVYEAQDEQGHGLGGTIPASKLRRQAPPQTEAAQEEGDFDDEPFSKPPTPAHENKEEAYGKKVLETKKNFGILSRRERILNVRYMTDTIKETSKNQNTLLESKVRSLFIQHLREEDSGQ